MTGAPFLSAGLTPDRVALPPPSAGEGGSCVSRGRSGRSPAERGATLQAWVQPSCGAQPDPEAGIPSLRDFVPTDPLRGPPAPAEGGGRAAGPHLDRLSSDEIAALAVAALRFELDTYPKPGLVSRVDSGSHADMDAGTFAASASALEPHLAVLARAGAAGLTMPALRRIGLAAEAAMRAATGGVNTHRGAIFGLGLLAAAAGALGAGGRALPAGTLGAQVRDRHAAGILDGPELLHAPGARARRRHGVGGAPAEAAAGFPTLYGVGLPALRRARALRPGDPNAARVGCCLALVATLEDTNLLHRGGEAGYRFARDAAARFEAAGGVAQADWFARAEALHRAFVARRLSPGGAADLLAMTLFVDALEAGA